MSEETTVAAQPAVQPTVQAAGNQPAAAQPTAQPQPQQPTQAAENWEERFKGLQRLYQQTVQQVQALQGQLGQQSQHAATLEQQLTQATDGLTQTNQTMTTLQTQLAQAARENQFWSLVTTEYRDLVPMATVIQRADTPDAQRQILNAARAALGGTVGAVVQQQVAQAFQGVTPGASPANAQPPQFSKEQIWEEMQKYHPTSDEYKLWKRRWDEHPDNAPSKLHSSWVDPLQSDWDRVRQPSQVGIVPPINPTGIWKG